MKTEFNMVYDDGEELTKKILNITPADNLYFKIKFKHSANEPDEWGENNKKREIKESIIIIRQIGIATIVYFTSENDKCGSQVLKPIYEILKNGEYITVSMDKFILGELSRDKFRNLDDMDLPFEINLISKENILNLLS